MQRSQSFAEVLEAVDRLSMEEEETLVAMVRLRLAEQGRKRLAADAQEAQRDFEQGRCRTATVDELMDEILAPD